jgi:hypothetical protein
LFADLRRCERALDAAQLQKARGWRWNVSRGRCVTQGGANNSNRIANKFDQGTSAASSPPVSATAHICLGANKIVAPKLAPLLCGCLTIPGVVNSGGLAATLNRGRPPDNKLGCFFCLVFTSHGLTRSKDCSSIESSMASAPGTRVMFALNLGEESTNHGVS